MQRAAKTKGILEKKLESQHIFTKHIHYKMISHNLKECRREIAFILARYNSLLKRIKASIKKDSRKTRARLQNYRIRFKKLFAIINFWKHYIVLYYKELADLFYKDKFDHQRIFGKDKTINLNIEAFSKELGSIKEREASREENPDFYKINIKFYMEELFIYILDVLLTSAKSALL